MAKEQTHGQVNNHLKEIVLLFSVPIGIVFIILAFIYVPRMLANPSYDFVYCEGGSNCSRQYTVDGSKRIDSTGNTNRFSFSNISLHYYDIDRGSSRPLTLEEAQEYELDTTSKSPDGYTLESRQQSGPFGSSWDNNWSLKKGILSKPVTLSGDNDRYSRSNNFIGWVLSDE